MGRVLGHLSIKRKILAVVILSGLAASALAASSVYFASRTKSAAHLLLESGIVGSSLANRLDLLLQQHRGLIRGAPAEFDRERLAASRAEIEALRASIEAEVAFGESAQGVHSPSWAILTGQLQITLPPLFDAGERVIALANDFVQDQAQALAEGPYTALSNRVASEIAAWRDEQTRTMNEQINELSTSSDAMVSWICGATGASLLAGIAGFAITQGVLRRLMEVQHTMLRIADRDPQVHVPFLADADEIGAMARAVLIFRNNALQIAEQQNLLTRANFRFEAALSNMSQGLCLYDMSGRLDVFNTRFLEIYNMGRDRIRTGLMIRDVMQASIDAGNYPGKTIDDIMPERQAMAARREPGMVLQELGDGRVIAVAHRGTQDGGWIATYEDVTSRRAAEAQIVYLARHDSLTGLPNRMVFHERLAEALVEAGRGMGAAVLCLDLDRFKSVNDTLGHPVGDGLLRAVADRLRAVARADDTVARLGGDEFAIVQAGVARPEDARLLAERILAAMAVPFEIEGHQLGIGTSIGLALMPGDGMCAESLLKKADTALYRAKSEGRGTLCFFEQDMGARLQLRRQLELDLRQGMLLEQFELFYQPLVNLSRDRVSGFEALLRWRHPERGMVSPAEFIPIAEEIGLIIPLGEWVIQRACADAATWPDHVKIAVNLSPVQFKSRNLVPSVAHALAASGLAAQRLELEITESVLLQDNENTLATLHALRALGAAISMDDFGTGYSSLSYLRSFPFDKIKIDQSFIRDLSAREDAIHIVRAVTGLCAGLGMITTAEGVETQEQLDKLRAEGCTEVQGFLFSAPKPAAEVLSIMRRVSSRASQGTQLVAAE